MGTYVYLRDEVQKFLDKECPKSEEGIREESYNTQIKRLLKIGGK